MTLPEALATALVAPRKEIWPDLTPEQKLVYSDEACRAVRAQIAALGSVELVLCRMFAPPCSYDQAREWSVTVAKCFEMDATTFMAEFSRLRMVALQRAKDSFRAASE